MTEHGGNEGRQINRKDTKCWMKFSIMQLKVLLVLFYNPAKPINSLSFSCWEIYIMVVP